VKVKIGRGEWQAVPLTHGNARESRGIGVAEAGVAIQRGERPRASGELGYHVVDVMQAAMETGEMGRAVEIESTVERPTPFPPGLNDGVIP
jgi:hypothetical protein